MLQMRDDPEAVPKLSALLFKLRSIMTPAVTSISISGVQDRDTSAAQIVNFFTDGLLRLTQSVLKVYPPHPVHVMLPMLLSGPCSCSVLQQGLSILLSEETRTVVSTLLHQDHLCAQHKQS